MSAGLKAIRGSAAIAGAATFGCGETPGFTDMELHAPEQLLPRALALADSFAGASPLAVSLVKRATGDAGALAAMLDAEANVQALAFGSAEHRDAVQRFLDKQPLPFQWPTHQEPAG